MEWKIHQSLTHKKKLQVMLDEQQRCVKFLVLNQKKILQQHERIVNQILLSAIIQVELFRKVRIDNTTAIWYIKKMCSKKILLYNIAQNLWDWSLHRNIIVVLSFIAIQKQISYQQSAGWILLRIVWTKNTNVKLVHSS